MTRMVTCVDPVGYLVQLNVGCDRTNGPGAYGSVTFGPRSNPLLESTRLLAYPKPKPCSPCPSTSNTLSEGLSDIPSY